MPTASPGSGARREAVCDLGRFELSSAGFAAACTPSASTRPARTASGGHPLRLLTLKRHHSINSSYGSFRCSAEPAQRCEIHPADAAQRGIADGNRVEVHNQLGRITVGGDQAVPEGTVAVRFGSSRTDADGGGATA